MPADANQARSKRSRFITLFQAATKSVTNLALCHRSAIDLGQRAKLRVRSEHEVDARCGPLQGTGLAVADSKTSSAADVAFHAVAHVEQIDEEVVGQRAGRLGEDAMLGVVPALAFSTRMPPTSAVISGAVSAAAGPCRPAVLPPRACRCSSVVAEAIGNRFENREASRHRSAPAWHRVRPGVKGTVTS